MTDIITQTADFMEGAGQPFGVDFMNSPDVRELRRNLAHEEWREYDDGEAANDLVETVDGAADQIVIAAGTLFTYLGRDVALEVLAEVGRSNLSKVDGSLGPMRRRNDGKILKPEGWTPPDIAGILRRHGFIA